MYYKTLTVEYGEYIIYDSTQKYLTTLLPTKNYNWKSIFSCGTHFKILTCCSLFLDLYKFCRAYTGMHKRSQFRFYLLTEKVE